MLLLDFESTLSVDAFVDVVRKRPHAPLIELFLDDGDLVVDGPEGAELIPALAEDLPEISEDGLTYSITLREN